MGSQEIVINRKKQNFRKKKRIVKKAHRHQPNVRRIEDEAPITNVSEKKQRREEKKRQAKLRKKAIKAEKRNRMDIQQVQEQQE